MNILLINSSAPVNQIIQTCLSGNNITITTNGNIDIPSETDLIIFDIQLMTNNIINSKIPCIILGSEQDEMLRIYIEKTIAGGDTEVTYINRPFTCEDLNGKVSLVIGG